MSGGFALGPALLFCPADRPDRFEKAASRADAVILDLEDAVAPHAKAAAREAVIASALDPARTIVRVNSVGDAGKPSDEFEADLRALAATGYRTVMLPKTHSAEQCARLRGFDVVALIETARGVLAAERIAAAEGVVAVMWGAEDLVASLGGTQSRHPSGVYRDVARHARSTVLLAAAAAGVAAIDSVHLQIDDLEGLRAEAADAAASGFAGTACIHPSQVGVIRSAYRPTSAELVAARAVLEAAATRQGVFVLDGRMVDEPIIRHAENIVRRASVEA